ncbi:MAG: hypothetical protein AAB896_00760 [Patescibacteria group bacterium]
MVVQTSQEIHNSSDVIRGYISFVEAGGGVETFEKEMVTDPLRPQLEAAPIICFTHDEEVIARRGLWNHLGIIYRGIKNKTRTASSRAIAEAINKPLVLADDFRMDAQQSIITLNRAYDYDEGIWLSETARQDNQIAYEVALVMRALRTKCPVDAVDQLDLARRIEARRKWVWKREIASLALDIEKRRAHPALIKLAEAIIDFHEPDEA